MVHGKQRHAPVLFSVKARVRRMLPDGDRSVAVAMSSIAKVSAIRGTWRILGNPTRDVSVADGFVSLCFVETVDGSYFRC